MLSKQESVLSRRTSESKNWNSKKQRKYNGGNGGGVESELVSPAKTLNYHNNKMAHTNRYTSNLHKGE